jgi:aspartyl-tRNA synthetase
LEDHKGKMTEAPSTAEEIAAKIGELGEAIKVAKAEKKPKEEWEPMLQEMLVMKAKYKVVTGEDFGGPPKQEKKKDTEQAGPSEKNKEKNAAKAAAKAEREKEKAEKRAERERREKEKAERLAGVGQENFGDMPLVQSQEITDKVWTKVQQLKPAMTGQPVLVRGHLQTTRVVGKGVFVVVRSSLYTVQGVAFENKEGTISNAMIKYIDGLPSESVVDMKGTVTVPENPVESVTQKQVEIQITDFHCVCKATQALPFLMEDAARPESGKETDIGAYNEDDEVQQDDGLVHIGQKMRLDYRWLDLRTPANQAIFRIESMVGVLFRECLVNKGFIEIHAPKLIGGASEGGSDVFTLNYFGQPACLAMSPQLHKQITCACSGFERVFTTGPVFRAENSNTRRHLCEFTGFDLEMVINEHYDEVLDLFSDLFIHIFDGLNERCKEEIERVREQHPFANLQYLRPTLKLTFAEGCALLREAGVEQGEYEDLSTENEKKLGDIVKQKYGTDFFFMDKYPLEVRPFYTMPDPKVRDGLC